MKFLNIYSNCQIVRGSGMSLICDLQLRKYHHIPNDMADVLDYLTENSVEQSYQAFAGGNKSTINSYIQYMVKNDLGFLDEEIIKELIPLSLEWDNYSPITNVIVELDDGFPLRNLFVNQLINLNASALEIRCYSEISIETLNNFLALINKSTIVSIKLILKWTSWCAKNNLQELANKHLRVNSITVHSSPESNASKFMEDTVSLLYTKANIESCLQCGNIQPGYFITNVELFTESQLHNTCLNRKLAIDRYGNIKNCPSLPQSFGHIDSANLEDVLANPEFKAHWFTKKDDIAICKDCEFRHVCTDCRAYVEDVNNPHSKPLKCGYDPYANTWEEWSLNPLKQNAIAYYGMEIKTEK